MTAWLVMGRMGDSSKRLGTPQTLQSHQPVITAKEFVPQQNQLGGFAYSGGTMAFTAANWALG